VLLPKTRKVLSAVDGMGRNIARQNAQIQQGSHYRPAGSDRRYLEGAAGERAAVGAE
jgi:hypothetical protein